MSWRAAIAVCVGFTVFGGLGSGWVGAAISGAFGALILAGRVWLDWLDGDGNVGRLKAWIADRRRKPPSLADRLRWYSMW